MNGRTFPKPAPVRLPGECPLVRVTAQLDRDAALLMTMGTPPRMMLRLQMSQQRGLGYSASVDLGTDVADHMAAEALLPRLRAGDWVSVGADGLRLGTDHGHPLLHLLGARDAMALGRPRPLAPTPAAEAPEEGTAC